MLNSVLNRRSAIVGALAVLGASGAVLASHAGAVACELTPYFRDGVPLTAARVVPADGNTFSGPIDATGCNIGIYVAPGQTATIDGVTIDGAQGVGPNYYGILVDQAHADITNSTIDDIGEAQPNGSQHGVAVAFVSGDVSGSGESAPGVDIAPASGTVEHNTIQRYQKGGVVVAGSQTNVTTDNNTVQGLGPVDYIAQNGIQYSVGASGQIFTNTVTDNDYTGCSNQEANKTGDCTAYFSTGILLYDINPPEIKVYNNFYRDDQRNLIVVPSSSLK